MCATALGVERFHGGEPVRGPALSGKPAGRPLRILHLEDSPSDSELALEHLLAEGVSCTLRRVETREQFEAALAEGGMDLILADYQLPGFDGLAAFSIALQSRPELPFIILTGNLGEDYAVDTLKLGVTDYVLKQSLSRLAPAVHRALGAQRERAQRQEAQEELQRYREHLEQEVRQRTAELEERNAQLAVANQDLETFVASATHDLRTPLVVIGGFSKRLARSCADKIDASELELLTGIGDAAAQMEVLLDELLAFFKASKSAPSRSPIDMQAAVSEAYARLAPLVGERSVRLEVSPLPPALGDPAMVRQVLVNLLTNAVKYTVPRDAAVIEVSGWEEQSATGYCVKDNGIGFDIRHREKIFELFHRVDETRGIPGTGVGLATVKRIVEKHGGKVWATGAAGQGASVCFTLPRTAAPLTH